ncbi:MAG: hypothetical protein H6724_03120 [Sandaracinus sp.]|nr:hypothetical protein [Sandaracinus sp.]
MAILCALIGCTPDPEVTLAGLTLRLPTADDCRPTVLPSELLVEALGDFPASDARTIELLRPSEGPRDIDRFPAETRLLTARARSGDWEAVGVRWLIAPTEGSLLLSPLERSCPSPDPALALSGGEAVALGDGSLAIVGGLEGTLGTRRLVRLRPGEVLADVLGGLAQRRVGHTTLAADDGLWVLGGALGTEGPAHDTWERFDLEGEPRESGVLVSPRRDFGAARLPDGRLLLVGGRTSGDGEPLADAEVVDPATGLSERVDAPFARLSPHVVVTDEGHVVVVGGVGTGGAVVLSPVFLFDPLSLTFVRVDVSLPRWASFDVAALPGGRLVAVGDAREGLEPQVAIVHVRDRGFGVELEAESFPWSVEGASEVRVAPLPDGRVLATGRRESRAFAARIDPSTGRSEAVDASRVPATNVVLADGIVAELGDDGASFRRPVLRTPFSNPPATLLGSDLALGGPTQWRAEGTSLVALEDDARATVATLRFASFRLMLTLEGAIDVLLGPELATPIGMRARAGEVGPAFCTLVHDEGAPVEIVRVGSRLTLRTGDRERVCTVDGLGTHVSIGFRADEGARLGGVELTRLE